MKQKTARRRAIDWVLAVLLCSLPALMLQASFKSPGNLTAVDRTILVVSAPLQAAVTWVIDGIGGIVSRYVWLVDVEEENDELRRENQRLQRELDEALRRAAEAARLEALVDLKNKTPAQLVSARVVAQGMSPYFRVTRITLDRGADVVKEGMAVLAPAGVVGRVSRVYGGAADVLLAVDAQSSIDVVVGKGGVRGLLKGAGTENAYAATVEYLLRGDQVERGDLVVTSGLGGVFPVGVPVGRVTKVVRAQYGLYQEVEVEPAVDFGRLSLVLVLTAAPPPPDKTGSRDPEPAFAVEPR